MNSFYEFEENYCYEDEHIPEMMDFYHDYATKLIDNAGIKLGNRLPSFSQLVAELEKLASNHHPQALSLLKDIYRDNII